jgi:hypothetical protein
MQTMQISNFADTISGIVRLHPKFGNLARLVRTDCLGSASLLALPQPLVRKQHSDADNLTSNHIYRMDRSVFTAGNQNTSTKYKYFIDISGSGKDDGWKNVRAH